MTTPRPPLLGIDVFEDRLVPSSLGVFEIGPPLPVTFREHPSSPIMEVVRLDAPIMEIVRFDAGYPIEIKSGGLTDATDTISLIAVTHAREPNIAAHETSQADLPHFDKSVINPGYDGSFNPRLDPNPHPFDWHSLVQSLDGVAQTLHPDPAGTLAELGSPGVNYLIADSPPHDDGRLLVVVVEERILLPLNASIPEVSETANIPPAALPTNVPTQAIAATALPVVQTNPSAVVLNVPLQDTLSTGIGTGEVAETTTEKEPETAVQSTLSETEFSLVTDLDTLALKLPEGVPVAGILGIDTAQIERGVQQLLTGVADLGGELSAGLGVREERDWFLTAAVLSGAVGFAALRNRYGTQPGRGLIGVSPALRNSG